MRFLICTILCLIACQSPLLAKSSNENESYDLKTISEALGHLIGKNLEELELSFDMDLIVKGIKNSTKGKSSPLTEEECMQAIGSLQEQAFSKKAAKNLAKATAFMEKNKSKSSVVTVEEGMLQYEVLQQGNGKEAHDYNSPIIHFTGSYMDGKIFGSSSEPELISLDETIEGFRKGIVGMKEGEKRLLYIHPNLGYKDQGVLEPNALLIFEIELIQADGSSLADEKVLTEDDLTSTMEHLPTEERKIR